MRFCHEPLPSHNFHSDRCIPTGTKTTSCSDTRCTILNWETNGQPVNDLSAHYAAYDAVHKAARAALSMRVNETAESAVAMDKFSVSVGNSDSRHKQNLISRIGIPEIVPQNIQILLKFEWWRVIFQRPSQICSLHLFICLFVTLWECTPSRFICQPPHLLQSGQRWHTPRSQRAAWMAANDLCVNIEWAIYDSTASLRSMILAPLFLAIVSWYFYTCYTFSFRLSLIISHRVENWKNIRWRDAFNWLLHILVQTEMTPLSVSCIFAYVLKYLFIYLETVLYQNQR